MSAPWSTLRAALRSMRATPLPEIVAVVVMSCPALIWIVPEVELTAWLTTTSLVAPVAVRVTVPEPSVLTPVPDPRTVIVPAPAVTRMLPLPAALVWLTRVMSSVVPAATSLIRMLPVVPELVASRVVMLVWMSSAEPIPVAAVSVARVPVMLAVSAVRLSVMAPVVAVTFTVLAAERMLRATLVLAV